MAKKFQDVDIEGLREAFDAEEISVTKCLAKSFKKLEELSEEEAPSKAKDFQARIAMGLIRAGSQLLKARPELAGKAAGTSSTSDLLAAAVSDSGEDHAGRRPEAAQMRPEKAPLPRLARPGDEYS